MAGFGDTSRRSKGEPERWSRFVGTKAGGRFVPSGSLEADDSDIPVPLKGMPSVPACDTALAYEVAHTITSPGKPPVMGLKELLSLHKESFIRLEQPILVGFTVVRGQERVKLYSECREIRHLSIVLTIPCRLGLDVGSDLQMELFLANGEPPLEVRGKVRKVKQSSGTDSMRYSLEVEFEHVGKEAEKRMAAFVHDARSRDRRPILS